MSTMYVQFDQVGFVFTSTELEDMLILSIIVLIFLIMNLFPFISHICKLDECLS